MIARAILLLAIIGWCSVELVPAAPAPMTAAQLQTVAKHKSKLKICKRTKKTKAVKEWCKQQGGYK